MEGWVSIHRQIMKHWTYEEKRIFSRFEAWVDLILTANHKDTRFPLGNEIVEAKRGDVITSEVKLMDKWGWSKTKLRNFLELAEKDGMIIKKTDRKKTTITIVNYGNYQLVETTERPQGDREETTERPREDTINNVNNDNNDNKQDKKNNRSKKTYNDESPEYKMAMYLYMKICEWTDKVPHPDMQKWANECRLILEKDNREKRTVLEVINWATKDDFWQSNILCPSKLRKQFTRLLIEMEKKNKKTGGVNDGRNGTGDAGNVVPIVPGQPKKFSQFIRQA